MPIRVFITLLLICFSATVLSAQEKKAYKIVLDAGHGGDKPGAIGHFSKEKDVALAVTLKLGELISNRMRGARIIYTRTTDVDIDLAERHEIANRAKGDIYISVHINSTPGRRRRVKSHGRWRTVYDKATNANGTECFVLGLSRMSQKDESVGEYSGNLTSEEGLLDVNDPVTAIILKQYANAFLQSSVDLGMEIQKQFAAQGRLDRGVKQKSLEVLAGCVMPGVLVEIGFINNVEEEKYMNTPKGQKEIAEAIYKGIESYIRSKER